MTAVPPAYDAWVPADGRWSAWAKAVPFAFLERAPREPVGDFSGHDDPALTWLPPPRACALVLDLPGLDAISAALAVARRGYRPVPLFNGCSGGDEVVPTAGILWGLTQAAAALAALALPADAPPAFLLDARRLSGAPAPERFDNRWVVTAEDLPSAAALRAHGIAEVIVIRDLRSEDLAAVLRRWAQGGLAITGSPSLGAAPHAIDLAPRFWRWLVDRLRALLVLRRAPGGGFGYVIPTSSGG